MYRVFLFFHLTRCRTKKIQGESFFIWEYLQKIVTYFTSLVLLLSESFFSLLVLSSHTWTEKMLKTLTKEVWCTNRCFIVPKGSESCMFGNLHPLYWDAFHSLKSPPWLCWSIIWIGPLVLPIISTRNNGIRTKCC